MDILGLYIWRRICKWTLIRGTIKVQEIKTIYTHNTPLIKAYPTTLYTSKPTQNKILEENKLLLYFLRY